MALVTIGAKVNQILGLGADYDVDPAGAGLSTSTSAVTTAEALVVTDVATLVADGASPMQGHVNTLNTDWGTLKTALDALVTSVGGLAAQPPGDVNLVINTSNVTNKRQLKAALRIILAQIDAGAGGLVS